MKEPWKNKETESREDVSSWRVWLEDGEKQLASEHAEGNQEEGFTLPFARFCSLSPDSAAATPFCLLRLFVLVCLHCHASCIILILSSSAAVHHAWLGFPLCHALSRIFWRTVSAFAKFSLSPLLFFLALVSICTWDERVPSFPLSVSVAVFSSALSCSFADHFRQTFLYLPWLSSLCFLFLHCFFALLPLFLSLSFVSQTNIGPILLSVNPYKSLPIYTPAIIDLYRAGAPAEGGEPAVETEIDEEGREAADPTTTAGSTEEAGTASGFSMFVCVVLFHDLYFLIHLLPFSSVFFSPPILRLFIRLLLPSSIHSPLLLAFFSLLLLLMFILSFTFLLALAVFLFQLTQLETSMYNRSHQDSPMLRIQVCCQKGAKGEGKENNNQKSRTQRRNSTKPESDGEKVSIVVSWFRIFKSDRFWTLAEEHKQMQNGKFEFSFFTLSFVSYSRH